ncbi:GPCR 89-related protein [Niveomyces insectorum RCEF 264]|uniref:GPCR 89-related protein n=1 Tax=Niveomyces insectorum RCEF 264 TaxID=1081102 RepID=A0A167Z4K1_9HYPO|nr:GPCR 89-related protein [Niveomyces insectorum RCEF 264]
MPFLGMGFGGASCGDDACAPPSENMATLSTVLSLLPFLATFCAVFAVVAKKVFPQLSRVQQSDDGEDHYLPASAPPSLRQAHAEHGARSLRRRLAAAAFATTTALAAVLAELILAEISEVVDPRARNTALRVTVPALLFLLIVLIPFLELQSVIAGSGWSFQRTATGRIPRVAWTLQLLAFGGWLCAFWSLGMAVPGPVESYMYSRDAKTGFDSTGIAMASRWETTALSAAADNSPFDPPSWRTDTARGLARACLERVGVIGISLMALLSGFASVSSPWQTFGNRRAQKRRRPVTDSDVERKEASLNLTTELLNTKRHRLRSLQRRVAAAAAAAASGSAATAATDAGILDAPTSGVFGKLVGSLKGMVGGESPEAREIKSLEMDISGLETMEAGLIASLSLLRSRRATDARAGTVAGKLLALPNYVFGFYCIYRILATSLTSLHRLYYPDASFSSSDPINRFLGLLAKHWDPKLDQLAWARQISFLLSGVILAASANSVLQTFHIFVRWTPGLLYQAQANLALLIGQIAATYVISSAMLLRSNLPKEMGSAVSDALESALEPGFVDRWFEGWFLVASAATAVGIWVGRTITADDGLDGWDDFGAEELGQKRS